MTKILCYVAILDGKVRRASLEVLTRCRALAKAQGGTVEAVVVDPAPGRYVDEVQRYGPDRLYTVEHDVFAQHVNAPLVAALAQVIAQARPDVVAMASSEAVKDVLGALAVRADAAALPDVSSFELTEGGVTALRPVLAAKFLAETEATGAPVLVSVRSGSYDVEEAPGEAPVEAVAFDFDESGLRQRVREVVRATGGAVDLSEARVVVAAGRGVRDEEGRRLVEELAGVLGGAIGASRAVVESGLFPATAQIGQTGKVVSPDLYIAVGISGAIQHVAGMTNSRVIVAVNRDPDAPIFRYATYGIAADLYKVLPAMIDEVKRAKGG